MAKVLVIGVGNLDRGDDGAGIAAARLIRAAVPYARVIESAGDAADLIDAWGDAEHVYLIDAMVAGAAPGALERFDAHVSSLPATFNATSSHAFGAAAAVELARVLGMLPPRLIVYGIEGADYTAGSGQSPAVSAAVERVARLVAEEIAAFS